jgi:hypothetical protein
MHYEYDLSMKTITTNGWLMDALHFPSIVKSNHTYNKQLATEASLLT